MPKYINAAVLMICMLPILKDAQRRNRNILSTVKKIMRLIETQPAADVAPVIHAKWDMTVDPEYEQRDFQCGACGGMIYDIDSEFTPGEDCYYYCPNCGADMRPSVLLKMVEASAPGDQVQEGAAHERVEP